MDVTGIEYGLSFSRCIILAKSLHSEYIRKEEDKTPTARIRLTTTTTTTVFFFFIFFD
jgi:hypothetical protein